MSSVLTMQFLEILAAEQSRNSKQEFLKEFMEDNFFKEIVRLTYEPLITFGVKNAVLIGKGDNEFTDETFAILDELRLGGLTGNKARATLEKHARTLDAESAELLSRILAKDLKVGINLLTIHKGCPGLVTIVPYMRCSTTNEVNIKKWDWSKEVYVQEKVDGAYCSLTVNKNWITMNTRKGQDYPIDSFIGIAIDAQSLLKEGYQYHGEILVKENNEVMSRKEGNGILNSVIKGGKFSLNQKPIFIIWDMVPNEFALYGIDYNVPYEERFKRLTECMADSHHFGNIKLIETTLVTSMSSLDLLFNKVIDNGGEGLVLKNPRGFWMHGTSRHQVKLKPNKDCELRVVSKIPGSGKNSDTFGSLLCMSEDANLTVGVAGFSDEERMEIHDNWEDWQNSIITVKYERRINDKYGKMSLSHPRFIERRFDKDIANFEEEIE